MATSRAAAALPLNAVVASVLLLAASAAAAAPVQLLVDTDVDADDVFAILYLLKQDPALFNLKAITISTNAWSDAGHAVNLIYDLLHMMGKDDISVGVGGEGGITSAGRFAPNVGGYLPLIEQRLFTWGGCRYRQSIPPGSGGLLDIDSMYGNRRQFLPQGKRHYIPLLQPTTQDVMLDTIQSGRTVVLLIGSHTNFATLLMTHPEVKQNIERVYIMGGGVNSSNPTGCCSMGSASSCVPRRQCGDRGNLFSATNSNPWAEFNIFADPFAAYQVFHSGVPITLVPLDATNTIPISDGFFSTLEKNQRTFEAQWVYQVLNAVKETWFNDNFDKEYFLWDSFTSGVLVSGIYNGHQIKENAFCLLDYKNVTVVTSNKPYGVQDGSNPFYDNRTKPEFSLPKYGIHSGHVQTGLQDPFCFVKDGKGKCMDGYTMETSAPEGILMQVGVSAQQNPKQTSDVEFAFQQSFIDKLNIARHQGLYNFESQFPCYKEVFYEANLTNETLGKPVILDMDISPGDIVTLLYLLKVPRKLVDLKAVTVSANGWSSAATIDIVYDVLHMMGRDDIPVGLGEFFSLGQAYTSVQSGTGDCTYRKFIPNGAGGLIDSDTLFGLARDLPRSPRRYTAQNSVAFGAPRNTDHPELRQPKAQEVIEEVLKNLKSDSKVTLLTGGPLTNIATFLSSNSSLKSLVKDIFIVGGSVDVPSYPHKPRNMGNVYTLPENTVSEFNFFLDPQAAKVTIESDINKWLIPLETLHGKSLMMDMLKVFRDGTEATPEASFVQKLLLTIQLLGPKHEAYAHTAKFMDEILGAFALVYENKLTAFFKTAPILVVANGSIAEDGWTKVDLVHGKATHILESIDSHFVAQSVIDTLNVHLQSAKIANFSAQATTWSTCN